MENINQVFTNEILDFNKRNKYKKIISWSLLLNIISVIYFYVRFIYTQKVMNSELDWEIIVKVEPILNLLFYPMLIIIILSVIATLLYIGKLFFNEIKQFKIFNLILIIASITGIIHILFVFLKAFFRLSFSLTPFMGDLLLYIIAVILFSSRFIFGTISKNKISKTILTIYSCSGLILVLVTAKNRILINASKPFDMFPLIRIPHEILILGICFSVLLLVKISRFKIE